MTEMFYGDSPDFDKILEYIKHLESKINALA